MKKYMIIFLFIFVLLAACGTTGGGQAGSGEAAGPTGTNEHVMIDWVDFVKLNDVQYTGLHQSVIANPDRIGKQIGKVKFKVADNVTNPQYRVKNGDAAFLAKGTKIYAVEQKPNYVAVKDKREVNGYKLFFADHAEGEFNQYLKDMDKDKMEKIEIYHQNAAAKPKLLNQISQQKDIESLIGLLDSGEPHTHFKPNHSQGPVERYQIVIYTNHPIAHTNMISYDHEKWFWHPGSTEILSNKIEKYLSR
ncbi:hypothetical protein GWK91_11275 [Virgibacillus sp. MSP4-1]|uniref:hypothetical protein n=1 Tax=Virgibacillus sp. MSP4-1 TaxID=2700081 RepID=UPI00039A289B|nr:hypothetical protein [Virgibacillus sp. MSP4-1]QHS23503.1 hypothetical protein GWK91_11275 [Virgibacillus sp. MSP4-1]